MVVVVVVGVMYLLSRKWTLGDYDLRFRLFRRAQALKDFDLISSRELDWSRELNLNINTEHLNSVSDNDRRMNIIIHLLILYDWLCDLDNWHLSFLKCRPCLCHTMKDNPRKVKVISLPSIFHEAISVSPSLIDMVGLLIAIRLGQNVGSIKNNCSHLLKLFLICFDSDLLLLS